MKEMNFKLIANFFLTTFPTNMHLDAIKMRENYPFSWRKTPWVEFPWWSNLFQRNLSSPGVHVSLLLVILFGSLGVYHTYVSTHYSYHGFMISPPAPLGIFQGSMNFRRFGGVLLPPISPSLTSMGWEVR